MAPANCQSRSRFRRIRWPQSSPARGSDRSRRPVLYPLCASPAADLAVGRPIQDKLNARARWNHKMRLQVHGPAGSFSTWLIGTPSMATTPRGCGACQKHFKIQIRDCRRIQAPATTGAPSASSQSWPVDSPDKAREHNYREIFCRLAETCAGVGGIAVAVDKEFGNHGSDFAGGAFGLTRS